MNRIGIFAGTFDPIHEGHLAFALTALEKHKLTHVLFLPEKLPPHKLGVSTRATREQKILDAIAPIPAFRLYRTEFSPITYRSLQPLLAKDFPDSTFFLLIGSDVSLGLNQWQNVDELTANWSIIVGMRDGQSASAVRKNMEKLGADFTLIRTSHAHVSSSKYKNRRIDD